MFAASKTDGSAVAPDAQFNYVTMLLHGDGTNGAQNNTFVDGSTNNFSITRNGNTTQGSFSPYGSNWSNYFNGSTDYLRYAGQSAFSFGTGDFTIEGWFFVNSLASGILAWDFRNSGGTNGAFPTLELSTNGQVQYFSDSAYRISSSSGLLTANTWAHIAVTRSGTNTKLFFNGTQAGSTYSDSTNYTVGAGGPYIGSGSAPSAYLTGYISNFRVVKGTAVYTSNFTPSTTPLTAITNTSLLTCQSNRFIDNSANNFTATIGGTPSVQRFNPFGTATAYSTSVIGGSGYFDGTGDSLNATSNAAFQFGTGDFTIEAWVYSTNLTGTNAIFDSRTGVSEANGVMFYIRADGMLVMYRNTASVTASTALLQNSWNHCALTRSGSTCTIWLNGVSVGTATDSTNLSQQNSSIGSAYTGSNNLMVGYISNLRVVKGTAVYTTAFTPPSAPLTAVTNTSLLLGMTNGAIFDNAMMNDLETVGNAQISTSVKKYGTGSIAFDGTDDYLQIPYSPNFQFGTGAYTVEFWINTTATSVWIMFNAATDTGIRVFITSTGKIQLNEQVSNADHTTTSTTSINNGAWNHVAFSRASGQGTKLFINGVSEDQGGGVYNFNNTNTLYIGTRSSLVLFLNGYLDDFRITNGYARYTANFTPPTSAFPNTGPN